MCTPGKLSAHPITLPGTAAALMDFSLQAPMTPFHYSWRQWLIDVISPAHKMRGMENDFVKFVCFASKRSLDDALLAHLAESRNLRKQIDELLDVWLTKSMEAEFLSWFLIHREELGTALRNSSNPFRLPERFNRPLDPSRWRRRR